MNNAATRDVGLLYDWTNRQNHRARLAVWILFAVVLHAAAYVSFRAANPPPNAIKPSTARLIVLAPGSDEARRLSPLIAASDPSLYATDRSALSSSPPAIPEYQPSFQNAVPPLQLLPERSSRLLPPLPRDDGPVVVNDAPTTTNPPRPEPARETTVTFAGDLAGREINHRPAAAFTARPGDPLARSRYLVAVAPSGTVRHVFEIEGTASADINAVSIPFLLGFEFFPTDADALAWGTATIHWGLDVRRQRLE